MAFRHWIASLILMISVSLALAAPAPVGPVPFRIGVAPHSSARVILEMYQPLRLSLEQALHQPVEIVTAPDFTEFARRGVAQQYDIAITTGHQARLLETDARYSPLLTYQADFKSVVLVDAQSRFNSPADLANTAVIGLSPTSLVTLWGQHWIHRNAIPGTTIRYVSASDSVAQLILKGEGSAGFMSLANYQNLVPAVRDKLRLVDESVSMAGRVYMLNARHAKKKDTLLNALASFAKTPEATQYFAKYKLGGYRSLEPRELSAMEPYANEVRLVLKNVR
jgi:phosphonate transport system substrate-binding protein